MAGAQAMKTTNLPLGTVKRRDRRDPDLIGPSKPSEPLVLNTKAKAKRIEKSESKRDAFYAEIERLYANDEQGARELLAKVLAKSSPKAKEAFALAFPKLFTDRVSHPRLEGHIEIVSRVVDTLEAMRRRKQLSEREYQAADHYRTCFDIIHGSVGGSLDFDRARGGSNPGSPPAPHYMLASEVVSEVKRHLYPKDYAVLHRVCALGMTIEQATAQLYSPVGRAQKEDCGRRLREGLSQMADRWFPENRGEGNRMRSHISERATVTDVESVPHSSSVAHATRDRVFRK